MLELLLLLSGIGACFVVMASAYPEDAIKCAVFSAVLYFAFYIVMSVVLFWLDCFSIRAAQVLCLILSGSGAGFFLIRRRFPLSAIRFPVRRYWVPLLIVCLALPLVAVKFGFFGMGQDEGVYQTQAINLMYGVTENQQDILEYNNIPSKEGQEDFLRRVHGRLLGFYTGTEFGEFPTYTEEDWLSPVSGIFHGIPSFPAVLALSGSILGLSGMSAVQTLFWICAVFIVYMTGRNLRWKKSTLLLAGALAAASPIIVWTAKSALTETFQVVLISTFLYFMTERRRWSPLGAAASIVTFSFFHVTAFIYMPLFVVLFFLTYVLNGRRINLLAGITSVLGFGTGLTMMAWVSPRYTYMNLGQSLYTVIPFMNDQNCLTIVWMVVALCVLFLGAFYWGGWRKRLKEFLKSPACKWLVRVVMLALLLWQAVVLVRDAAAGEGILQALQSLTLYAFSCLTGFLALPIACVGLWLHPERIFTDTRKLVVGGAFLYCILFYSAFLSSHVWEYYYYARYLAPYIPVLALCAGMVLDAVRTRIKVVTLAVSMVILTPFEYVLMTQKDDTHMPWDVVEEIVANIDEEDVVLMDDDMMRILYFPVRTITGAAAYPCFGDVLEQAEYYLPEDGNVYCLADGKLELPFDEDSVWYRRDYETSLDLTEYHNFYIPLPLDFTKEIKQVVLYRYNGASNAEGP